MPTAASSFARRRGSRASRSGCSRCAKARFDEELPPAPFVFEPPPGEIVRSVEDVYGVDYVRISSDTLDLDALLAVGGSLVEAPTELPPVLYS